MPDPSSPREDAGGASPPQPNPALPVTPGQEGVAGATSISNETGPNGSFEGAPSPMTFDAGASPEPELEPVVEPVDAASAPCAVGERLGPNGHCHFLEASALTWDAARAACQARGVGWDLVSVRSAADAAFLGDILTAESWIGATDAASEGTWVWVVDGQPFWLGNGTGAAVDGAYSNWNSTEPNGGLPTNCARALPDSFGSPTSDAPWADLDCAALRGAVCEAYPPL